MQKVACHFLSCTKIQAAACPEVLPHTYANKRHKSKTVNSFVAKERLPTSDCRVTGQPQNLYSKKLMESVEVIDADAASLINSKPPIVNMKSSDSLDKFFV